MAGLSRQSGSNTARTRICWARSSAVELMRHQIALLDADAMFAGEAAAEIDAELQQVIARRLGLGLFGFVVDVVEDSGCMLPSPA